MVMEDGGVTNFKLGSLFMHSLNVLHEDRITKMLNKANILTEVMHLYSTLGLTCYLVIESCIVTYLRKIQTV